MRATIGAENQIILIITLLFGINKNTLIWAAVSTRLIQTDDQIITPTIFLHIKTWFKINEAAQIIV